MHPLRSDQPRSLTQRLRTPGSAVPWTAGFGALRGALFGTLFLVLLGAISGEARAAARITSVPFSRPAFGVVGQPIVLFADGLTGSSSVRLFFSNGSIPSIEATTLVVDKSRGILLAYIPAGAATGLLKVTADGVDSNLYQFRVLPGTHQQGSDIVTGQVKKSGGNVSNAVVLLLRQTGCDDTALLDFAQTDGSGQYTMHGFDGVDSILVFPPVSSNLAGSAAAAALSSTPLTLDITLSPGVVISGRVVDTSLPPAGIAKARLGWDGNGHEEALTDASGNFTLRLPAGAPDDWEYSVIPPPSDGHSTLVGTLSVGGSNQNVGDLPLSSGIQISGHLTRAADGMPIAGSEVSISLDSTCCTPSDRKTTQGDGSFLLVVPPGETYDMAAYFDSDSDLVDAQVQDLSIGAVNVVNDLVAVDAARISGIVTDRSSGLPLSNIQIGSYDPLTPQASSGNTSTCTDGSYALRLPVTPSGVLVSTGVFQPGGVARVTYDGTVNGTFFDCQGVLVGAAAGGAISGIDFHVPSQSATIYGTVSSQSGGCTDHLGDSVSVDEGQDHPCSMGQRTYDPQSGVYSIIGLPDSTIVAGLRACATESGFDPQCYNAKTPPAYDPIAISTGGSAFGVDFCLASCQQQTWHPDADGDDHGNPNSSLGACDQPNGYVLSSDDCNDAAASVHPGAPEICGNLIDDDCDTAVDEAPCEIACPDADLDGYLDCSGGCSPGGSATCGDCDDQNPSIHPAAADTNCNGLDENCDGGADEGYGTPAVTCGIGTCARSGTSSCILGAIATVCTPGTPALDDAICNGLDEDCDGSADEDYVIPDSACGTGACASVGTILCASGSVQDTCVPGAPSIEICDQIDGDCDGTIDEGCPMGLMPPDGTPFPALTTSASFSWSTGGQTRFQVQFSSSADPFVPQILSSSKFKKKTSYLAKKKAWVAIAALAPAGTPIYWRIVGQVSKKDLTRIESEVHSFTIAP